MHPIFRSLGTVALVLCTLYSAHADTPVYRSTWVINKIYNHNHPLAGQRPNELSSKIAKMQMSPTAFYNATAHLFFEDMNSWKPSAYTSYATGNTWISGDMQLGSMGATRDAAGNFVFDTIQFDEGYWGQYVWDVRRMAVSIVLAAKENGLSNTNQDQLVREFVDAYLSTMEDFRSSNEEKHFRLTANTTTNHIHELIKKSAGKTRLQFLAANTTVAAGNRKFINGRGTSKPSNTDYTAIQAAMADYIYTIALSKRFDPLYYKVKDIRTQYGTSIGNMGRKHYDVLIQGISTSTDDDVILELTQQNTSAVAIASKDAMPTWAYENHEGQRAARTMQAAQPLADALTGWTTLYNMPYLVREKSPYTTRLDAASLKTYSKFSGSVQYIGKILAKNHAVSDKDHNPALSPYNIDKEIADIVTNKTGFKDELTEFAKQYAQQVQWDWTAFVEAGKAGVALY